MTGMPYACRGEMRLDEILNYMKTTRIELLLVRCLMPEYGYGVEGYEIVENPVEMLHGCPEDGMVLRGKVSRLDLAEVLYVMENIKDGDCLHAKVVYVSIEGAFCALEIDVPDYVDMNRIEVAPSVWDGFGFVDAWAPDGMLNLEMFDETVKVIKVLDHGFKHPDKVIDKVMELHILKLMELVRYDVSRETQDALRRFRELVRNHPSERIRALHDRFIKEINDIGSSRRIAELRDVYFPKVTEDMNRLREQRRELNPLATMEEQQLSAEKALRSMPRDLFLQVKDKGQLIHNLLYTDIPRKKLLMVIDAVCLYEWRKEEEDVCDTVIALPVMVSRAISTDAVRSRLFREAMERIADIIALRGSAWKWSHVKKVLEDEEMISVEINSEFAREINEILPDVTAGACRKSVERNVLRLSTQELQLKYWELSDTNMCKRVLVAIASEFEELKRKLERKS